MYTLQKQDIVGATDEPVSEYDLVNITIVRRGEKDSDENIFKYLSAVFSANLAGIKEYTDIKSESSVEQEVRSMSGLGQSIMERGIRQGIEQGIERGDLLRLIRTTYKKMLKGKTNEEISDEVEEDILLVERIKGAILEERRLHDGEGFDARRVLEVMGEGGNLSW